MKSFIVFLLCVYGCFARGTYRAGVVVKIDWNDDLKTYFPNIYEAGKANVDIVLLPSIEGDDGNYDELVDSLAKAAREANVYVVAHLNERARCHNKDEDIRSNVVFDREGIIVAVSRKPVNTVTNCTIPSSEVTTFKTDFGVVFGLLMEEDLVLQDNKEYLKELKDAVVAGRWNSEIPFLNAEQFSSSWTYTNKANLITHTAVYSNGAVLRKNVKNVLIADINDTEVLHVPVINPAKVSTSQEDLNQYITKPLDMEASTKGIKETVCHNDFCCEFDIKTRSSGKLTEANYGLAVFNGMRHYGGSHYISIQSCGVYTCAGLYKRSCDAFKNNTYTSFENIIIKGNFTEKSTQYPEIVSTQSIKTEQFDFTQNGKQATASLNDVKIHNFGIISRDFGNDVESIHIDKNIDSFTFYDYIFNDSVQEFFDYLWIRLRILIFVVSIYILEMM